MISHETKRELADKVKPFSELRTRREKDIWYQELGRVAIIIDELEKRNLLKEES